MPQAHNDSDAAKAPLLALNSTFLVLIGLGSALWLAGCATSTNSGVEYRAGESVVLIGEERACLAELPLRDPPLRVRNTYLPGPDASEYVEGRDFLVDYTKGTLCRVPGSRVPDFRTNMLYGQKAFDHTKFPGFGNRSFFAFVDYTFRPVAKWPDQPDQTHFLKTTVAKLRSGQALKIVAFGDSITAGGDASTPELIFWQRWADELKRNYPRAQITAINGATGGDSTAQGSQRLEVKVVMQKPDLVLIGFGMNDHNIGGVPIPQFQQNLKQIIHTIRRETGAEMILFSAFPPNPEWKFGSHRMAEYAATTQQVAREESCAFADVFNNWQALAARKKPEDLLGNNVNHPNDFGHWIYFRVFQKLGL